MTDLATIAAQLDRIERKVDALLAERGGEAAETGPDSRAEAIVADLHERAVGMGISIGPCGTVGEYDAARLLGKGAGTLRNWRYESRPLPYARLGGRIAYRLDDLAAFMAERE